MIKGAYILRNFQYQEAAEINSQQAPFYVKERERRLPSEQKFPEHGLPHTACFYGSSGDPIRDLVVLDPVQLLHNEPLQIEQYELIIMTYQSRASFHFLDSSAPFVKSPFPKMDHSITVKGLVATWLPDHVLQCMIGIALSQPSMQVYQNLKLAE